MPGNIALSLAEIEQQVKTLLKMATEDARMVATIEGHERWHQLLISVPAANRGSFPQYR